MKKILFNDKFMLTEAVLSGRKTQTRRIVKRNQLFKRDPDGMWTDDEKDAWEKSGISESDFQSAEDMHNAFEWLKSHAPYKVGEEVAVAQSYKDAGLKPDAREIWTSKGTFIFEAPISSLAGWRNKMFTLSKLMPNRIRITNVRVERLNEISAEDCIKEGVVEVCVNNNQGNCLSHWEYNVPYTDNRGCTKILRGMTPQEAYAALIDKISGRGTFESNPWVFVYDFELVK